MREPVRELVGKRSRERGSAAFEFFAALVFALPLLNWGVSWGGKLVAIQQMGNFAMISARLGALAINESRNGSPVNGQIVATNHARQAKVQGCAPLNPTVNTLGSSAGGGVVEVTLTCTFSGGLGILLAPGDDKTFSVKAAAPYAGR